MTLDPLTLDTLRQRHPAWRLLRSDHAPVVAAFLHRVFVAPNVRTMAAADLAEALEDELFALRRTLGAQAFPRPAMAYLDEWAAPERGWLRKFYRHGSDEPQFDLTPATEKAIAWLVSLTERAFVGTESRLRVLFDLVQQMSEGSDTDPQRRLAELQRRRDAIDVEIARLHAGELALLDDTALKDRFQQFLQIARELLSDFREVEHNFRQLDRAVRERIALWDGAKGALLERIMGERDAITDSDQGRSFRAFWDFLMSPQRQDELGERLDRVLALAPVAQMRPDPRTRRIHHDWLEAGQHAQRTVAQLSQQLRRFLDDRAWLENRRIMDLLRGIEAHALALREMPPAGAVTALEAMAADIHLVLERPLYAPVARTVLQDVAVLDADGETVDASALYTLSVVDAAELARHIRQTLQHQAQVTLAELVAQRPLRHGLAELVTYLQLGADRFETVVDESARETVRWEVARSAPRASHDATTPLEGVASDAAATSGAADAGVLRRSATLPRVVFVRAVAASVQP